MQKYTWQQWVAVIGLLFLFVDLRLFQARESLFFFGDLGRDYYVLQEWLETGKPPLLGPQTSALPFNQSAWYFYLLLPGYLLTNADPLSSMYSSIVIHVLIFGGLLWWLAKRKPEYWWRVWLAGLVLAVQPQMVLQQRLVWNPSFVALFLVVGIVVSLVWRATSQVKKPIQSWAMIAISGLALALAIGFSYSAAPAVLLWLVILSWRQVGWWRWWLGLGVGLGVTFAPMVFFELRHQFPLTKMMLFQEKLVQQGTDLPTKVAAIERFVLAGGSNWQNWLLLVSVVVTVGLALKSLRSPKNSEGILLLVWFLTTTLAYLFLPVQIQAHYVFPLLVAATLSVVWLQGRWRFLLVGCWLFIWLQPKQLQQYLIAAPRSIEQSVSCAQMVCAAVKEPLFVSVQANFYPYHNGIEFQYLLKQAGCIVKKLDTQINEAQLMAVFVEDSVYEHGKTAYNELTQFGSSTELQKIECNPKLNVRILRKQ